MNNLPAGMVIESSHVLPFMFATAYIFNGEPHLLVSVEHIDNRLIYGFNPIKVRVCHQPAPE